jgi:hypothetical protein
MCKPTIEAPPIILVLLDFWPLRRGQPIGEKAPFALASIVVCVVIYAVHRGAAVSLEVVPLLRRIENALEFLRSLLTENGLASRSDLFLSLSNRLACRAGRIGLVSCWRN